MKIAELVSSDIRSRANASIIRATLDGINENVTLDFDGVEFVSRSFADELYEIMKEYDNISIKNTSDIVKSMMDAVVSGRKSKRKFNEDNSEIREFDDMNSLSSFLLQPDMI